jgi:hypothetical protein
MRTIRNKKENEYRVQNIFLLIFTRRLRFMDIMNAERRNMLVLSKNNSSKEYEA